MVYILLALLGLGGIFCLYLVAACLLAASRENSLPDIKDVEVSEISLS